MSTEVTLPALGESVTEGTVSRWLKQVGERVEADEALLEVSTDKVDTEIPAPVAGTLLEIRVPEDETCPVGGVLGVIGEAGASAAPIASAETVTPPARAEGHGSAASAPTTRSPFAPPTTAPTAQPAPTFAPPAEPAPWMPPPPPPATPAHTAPSSTEAPPAPSAPAATSAPAAANSAPAPTPAPAQSPTPAPSAAPAPNSGSSTEVTLPALGESVTEGTVSRWLKQVGERVEADEALLEVSTDKVDTEIPAPVAGTLLEIRVPEDETCPVGGVLGVIGEAGASAPSAGPAPQPQAQAAVASPPQPAAAAGDSEPASPSKATTPPEASASSSSGSSSSSSAAPQPEPAPESKGAAPSRAATGDPVGYVTPLVRKLAAEAGVDLATVTGTGVGGRIRKQDIQAAAAAAAGGAASTDGAGSAGGAASTAGAGGSASAGSTSSAPTAGASGAGSSAAAQNPASGRRGTTESMSRMRTTIARRMVESLQVSAQLTATVEVDLTAVSRLRAQVKDDFKRREGTSLSYLPFITKATVEALKQFPQVNATIDTEAGTISYSDAEHIGIAVDTPKGLMVPVVKDAGDLNIAGLAKKIADLAARSRSSKVTPDELSGGTFTITNYGSAGTLFDTPIINQPQVAILGTGALVKRPVVVEDDHGEETIAVRHMMYLSMTYDHRMVDGADAARFLTAVKTRLEAGDFTGDL